MSELLARALRNKRRVYIRVWKVVVKVSDRTREIAEYIELFAKKHHMTPEEALDYVMVKIFKEYREHEDNGSV